jgi:hypothetical protein
MIAGLFSFVLGSCYADLGEDHDEQRLSIALDPAPGSVLQRTMGTTYDFKVLVKSAMPPQGVNVNVVYRQDSDNQVVFNQNYTTTTSPLNVTINNIPFNEIGTVVVTVVSRTYDLNKATETFKLVRK